MARIYVSSTYSDLKAERRVVAKTIRRLGHYPVTMEDYVASNIRPLDRCIRDVKNSHALVSIIAWRYGYIPAGSDKSIIYLEYLAARDAAIPLLVFLLREDAPWPKNRIDNDTKQIEQFREVLMREHLVNFFVDRSQLQNQVTEAVARLTLERVNSALRNFRVYLSCNQKTQHIAELFSRRLRDEGISTWLAHDGRKAGKFRSHIMYMLRETDIIIVFCSSRTLLSKQQLAEVEYNLQNRSSDPKHHAEVLVLRLDDCDLPDLLTEYHIVDFFEDQNFDEVLRALYGLAAELDLKRA